MEGLGGSWFNYSNDKAIIGTIVGRFSILFIAIRSAIARVARASTGIVHRPVAAACTRIAILAGGSIKAWITCADTCAGYPATGNPIWGWA